MKFHLSSLLNIILFILFGVLSNFNAASSAEDCSYLFQDIGQKKSFDSGLTLAPLEALPEQPKTTLELVPKSDKPQFTLAPRSAPDLREMSGGHKKLEVSLIDRTQFEHKNEFHPNIKVPKIYETSLEQLREDGTKKYLKYNGELKFPLGKNIGGDLTGAVNQGIHETELDGKTLIVKKIGEYGSDSVKTEAQTAISMHTLGIGPETSLIWHNNENLLIMDKVPGINTKELLYPSVRTSGTKARIEKILGYQTESMDKAVQAYAQKILNDPAAIERLREIGKILEANKFSVPDFQVMILPKGSGQSTGVSVIDRAAFSINPNGYRVPFIGETHPRFEVEDIIAKLKILAGTY